MVDWSLRPRVGFVRRVASRFRDRRTDRIAGCSARNGCGQAGERPRAFGRGAAGGSEEGVPASDEHWGCGWFDSSFELRRGLAVIEEGTSPLELAVLALLTSADGGRRR